MRQLCGGIHFDTDEEKVALPEVKVLKLRVRLSEPAFDFVNTKLPLWNVQCIRGDMQFCSIANPSVLPLLGALDRLLSTMDEAQRMVKPKGTNDFLTMGL